jgi:translation initiation factor 2 beta subunit (eIF-2beta)/eIF-5
MINECQSLNSIYDELNEDIISSDNKYVEYFDKIFNNSKSLKDISAVIKSMIFSEDVYTALNDYIINKYIKLN